MTPNEPIIYRGPERRKSPRTPGESDAGSKAQHRTIAEVETAFEHKLREHEEREKTWLIEYVETAKQEILAGFPGGDLSGHCNYHQAKIDAAREEKEFWKLAKLKLVERGVGTIFDVMRIVAILALGGLLMKLGLGAVAAKWLG